MISLLIYLLVDFCLRSTLGWVGFFFFSIFLFTMLNDLYRYYFSLDFVSYIMVLLTFLVISYMYNRLKGDKSLSYDIGRFYISLMIMTLFFVFLTLDFFVFYFSFEFVVVPIFLMILMIGRRMERLQSAIYLFLYTLISSIPFLVFIILFYIKLGSLRFSSFFYSDGIFSYWWSFVILVFLVKLPVFLVHLWLPKAHVEAPLVGSIILAGVLLKLGGYGLFKVHLFCNDSFWCSRSFYSFLGIYGALLISFVCLSQVDIKSLIAYSSIVHIGPVLLGILVCSWIGWWGSFMIMLSHGVCSSGMFYILSLLYDRVGSRSLLILKGLNIFIPFLSYFWFSLAACNMSVPPTFNFYSELVFMLGVLGVSFFIRVLLGAIFVIVGIYNVFFFVSVNHRISVDLFSSFNILFSKEFSILFYHSFPLLAFPLFFSLFCLFSLYKMFSCGLKEIWGLCIFYIHQYFIFFFIFFF